MGLRYFHVTSITDWQLPCMYIHNLNVFTGINLSGINLEKNDQVTF